MNNLDTQILNKSDFTNELTGSICTRWAGQPVCVYESIDSTNAECTRLKQAGAKHGTVAMAMTQTAGRGRRGRSWDSPAGENLYFSLLLTPDIALDKAPMLTLIMAVATARGIGALTGHGAEIKWPNDLVLDGKKVCGILTEMRMEQNRIDYVVIGVGVNVKDRGFSEELKDKATALETVCGPDVSIRPTRLLETILKAFEDLYEAFVTEGDLGFLLEEYNSLLINRDREVMVLDPQGNYNGIARGITDTGELIVELADGERREVFAGEVSVRGIYGYV